MDKKFVKSPPKILLGQYKIQENQTKQLYLVDSHRDGMITAGIKHSYIYPLR